jgi:hypothetical protein
MIRRFGDRRMKTTEYRENREQLGNVVKASSILEIEGDKSC